MKYILIGALASICILAFNVHTLRGIIEATSADLMAANAKLTDANARVATVQSEAAICRNMIHYGGEPVMLLHVHN